MEQPIITVLLALITAGVIWIARTTHLNAKELAVFRMALFGPDGDSGVVGRVNSLHDWRNDFQRRELELAREENRRLQDKLDQQVVS